MNIIKKISVRHAINGAAHVAIEFMDGKEKTYIGDSETLPEINLDCAAEIMLWASFVEERDEMGMAKKFPMDAYKLP